MSQNFRLFATGTEPDGITSHLTASPDLTAPNESIPLGVSAWLTEALEQRKHQIGKTLGTFSNTSSLRLYDLMLGHLAETKDHVTEFFLRAREANALDDDGFSKLYPDIVEFTAFIADSVQDLEKRKLSAVGFQSSQPEATQQQTPPNQPSPWDDALLESAKLDFHSRVNEARRSGKDLRGVQVDIDAAIAQATAEARKRFVEIPVQDRETFSTNNATLLAHINFLRGAQNDVAQIRESEKQTLKLLKFSREIKELDWRNLDQYIKTVMEPEIAATDALIAARLNATPEGTSAEDFKAGHTDLLKYANRLESLYAHTQKKFPVLTSTAPVLPVLTIEIPNTIISAPIYTEQGDLFGPIPSDDLTPPENNLITLPDWSYHPSEELIDARSEVARLVKEQATLESFLQAKHAKVPKSKNKKIDAAHQKIFENAYPDEHERLTVVKKLIQEVLDAGESEYRKHYHKIMINDLHAENNHLMPHFIAHLQSELASPRAERVRLVQDLWKNRHNPSCKDDVARMKVAHAQVKSRVIYMDELLLQAEHFCEIRNRPDYETIMECEPVIDPKKLRAAQSNSMKKLGAHDDKVFDDDYLSDDERVINISALTHLDDFIEPIFIPIAAGARILGNIASAGNARLNQFIKEHVTPKIEFAKTAMANSYKATKKEFFKSLLQPKKLAGYAAAAISAVGVVAIGASVLTNNNSNNATDADNIHVNGDSKNIYVSIAESWNQVKGDVLSSSAKATTQIKNVTPAVESSVAAPQLRAANDSNAQPHNATVEAEPEQTIKTFAKISSKKIVNTPRPAATFTKVTVSGVPVGIDLNTHKNVCNFMAKQGQTSWLCQQPS